MTNRHLMNTGFHTLALMFLLFTAAACRQTQDTKGMIAVRDSSGVSLVEISPGSGEALDLIASAPSWTLGAGEDDVDLHGVTDVRFVDHERVLIADAGSQEVIGFHIPTKELRRWGGRGYGPMEFRVLTSLEGSTATEVVALDRDRRRVVRFDYLGVLVDEWLLPESVGAHSILRLHQSRSGSVYLAEVEDYPLSSSTGIYRGVAPLLRLKPTLDTVTMVTGAATFHSAGLMGGVLFGATSVTASSANGVWIGDNARPEIVLWNDSGQPIVVIRWDIGDKQDPTARIRAFWRRVDEELGESNPSAVREMRSVLPVADILPAFSTVIEADDGRVWIGSYVSSEYQTFGDRWPRQEWLVIDRTTRNVWKAATPEGFRLFQVAHNSLLGVHTDELGVQSVRVYALTTFPETTKK